MTPHERDFVITRALDGAGRSRLPDWGEALRGFLYCDLAQSLEAHRGSEVAMRVCCELGERLSDLLGDLDGGPPLSSAPSRPTLPVPAAHDVFTRVTRPPRAPYPPPEY
jgi:hypothetical protein